MFKKYLVVLLILTFWSGTQLMATHQRAAEITYKWIQGLTYEVTITMYTYTPSPADDVRTTLPISWGDNSGDDIPRVVFANFPDNYTLNVYRMDHTFPASGSYTITVEDPNRNFGVVNIPNSVNVPMFVESTLNINPFLGPNNSVQLLNPPIDQGCVGRLYEHNASAFDPDGDSLSYRLVECKGAGGLVIPGYTLPLASNSFSINEITGDLTWDTPVLQGEYNIAFVIEEWRNAVIVGSVVRDMQILIGACNNNPPEINTIDFGCVTAGESMMFDVSATDPDGNAVLITASGAPFEFISSPAAIVPDPGSGTPTATTTFFWNVTCDFVARNPYNVLFKARDVHPEVSLSSLKSVSISVIAPAIEGLQAVALGNGINLSWNPSFCENSLGYKIYRKSGTSGFEPTECQTGLPVSSGFILIATTEGMQSTSFRDENEGQGLVSGIDYCYRVIAYFEDGAESKASNEACARLKRDLPIMTHVSNDSLQLTSGNVLTAWSKPTELDTIQYPGPYKYDLIRYQGNQSQNPVIVYTASSLNDTLFKDNSLNINTSNSAYRYEVKLSSFSVGEIGVSRSASSVFLEITPDDRSLRLLWAPDVPWINDSTEVFRSINNEFVKIGASSGNSFIDTDLVNGASYQYYVRTIGGYSAEGIVHPIINYSQINSGIPVDNKPPCPPYLDVSTNCELIENALYFSNLADSCSSDIHYFQIYFTPSASMVFQLIDSVDITHNSFTHRGLEYVTGCYFVKAVDSVGNISIASNIVCVDYTACPIYELPNVFTPNADQFNDLFVPMNYPSVNPKANIDRIVLSIFNRWGNIVFETSDPVIEWDGKDKNTGQDCSDGVYFYTCDVFFTGFDGPVELKLQGSVTIIR